MKKRLIALFLCLLIAVPLPQTALASTTTVAIDVTGIESDHNYANRTSKTWTLSCPGADSITMTFDSQTAFESNYDYLYIYNSGGTQVGKYSGTELASKTITVSGEKATLSLTSDSSNTYWGFKVTEAYGSFIEYDCTITTEEAEHGTVSVSATQCDFDETITITATPDSGYGLAGTYVDGELVDGSFVATKANHVVSAQFVELFPGKTITANGTCGGNLEWYLFSDGQLYITGTGAMTSYSTSNAAPWYSYRDQITSVVIDNLVTSIGGYAFYYCSAMTDVTIPNSVTSISNCAFAYCSGLTSVTVPSSVTSIGSAAFRGCSSLVEMTLPFVGGASSSSASSSSLFGYIFGTSSYTGGTSTKQYYRSSSSYYTTYYIPSSLRKVQITGGNLLYGAFYNCSNLTCVILPDSITSVGTYAFYNCSGLTDVFCANAEDSISIGSNNTALTNAYWHNIDTQLDQIVASSILDTTNGLIYHSANFAAKGETIAITAEPESGYRLAGLTIDYGTTSGGTITVAPVGDFTQICIGAQFEPLRADATPIDGGTCGTNLKWSMYEDGTLYITGSGAMSNYSSASNIPWYEYQEQITTVDMDDTVTTIGNYAFSNCSALTNINIPDSVTTVGSFTFSNCSTLTGITIPNSITSIGAAAFYNCSALMSIAIPNRVTTIGSDTFSGCSGLTSVTIPDSVTTIGSDAFSGCAGLTSVTIPDSVTSIGSYAFSGCAGLTSVTVPSSVTSIGSAAFSGCSGLVEIVLPFVGASSSATSASSRSLFGYIFGTSSYTGSTATIQYYDSYSTYHSTYYIPSSLRKVQITGGNLLYGAFCYCSKLTCVILPDSITSVSTYAFRGCSGLTDVFCTTAKDSVTINSSNGYLTGAYWHAADVDLSDIVALTAINENGTVTLPCQFAAKGETIPVTATPASGYRLVCLTIDNGTADRDSVTVAATGAFTQANIGAQFELARADKAVVSGGTCGTNLVWTIYDDGELYIAGTGVMTDYSSSSAPWANYRSLITALTIEPGVGTIGKYAFCNCTALTSVTIPAGVTSIGDRAFSGCSALVDVSVPETVTSFGSNVFTDCPLLTSAGSADTSATIRFGWTDTIYNFALHGCNYMTEVTIPESVTSIGEYAFSNCTALAEINLPVNLKNIQAYAFSYCSSLTSVAIPDGTELTGTNIFFNCTALSSVTIPGSVTKLPDKTFQNCAELTGVTMESGVETIGNYAFASCSGLTEIVIPDSVTGIGDYAFSGCSALTSVTLPANLETINPYLFQNCSRLKGIAISDTVTAIDSYAFSGCSSLASVELPDALNTIGEAAFSGCSALTAVIVPGGTTTIGNYAFSNCSKLASVTIPGSVTTIGAYSFQNCTKLTGVTIPEGVTTIQGSAFKGCSALTNVTISASVTTMSASVFSGCPLLTSVGPVSGNYSIRYAWTAEIPANAFGYCASLATVTIPKSVTSIGNSAFYGCSGLTNVYYTGTEIYWATISIGSNNTPLTNAERVCISSEADVLTISMAPCENGSFSLSATACTAGTEIQVFAVPEDGYKCSAIYVDGTAIEGTSFTAAGNHTVSVEFSYYQKVAVSGTCGSNVHWYLYENGELYITGSGAMGTYASYTNVPWYSYRNKISTVIIDGSVTSISDYAFHSQTNITTIELPSTLKRIGSYAFFNCDGLTNVVIPDNVTYIGSNAFNSCSNLIDITLPSELTSILSYTFAGCAMTELHIPDKVTSIADRAFGGCSSLTVVTLPDGLTYIGNYAFTSCADLVSINIPDSVTSIGESAFANCSSLIDILIPDGVTTVEFQTFATCTDLVTLTIPGSVTEVKSNAFNGCSELDSVFYIGTEEDWNDITIGVGNMYLTQAQRYYISSEEEILRITPASPENGTVTVNRLACVAGVEVQVTAIPNPGYKLGSIMVDGVPITGNTFTASGNHTVSAQFVFYKDVVDSGTCGENARWVLYTDGELRIAGTGNMAQYYYTDFPWYKYREQVTSLIIEDGIISISGSAFYCPALVEVTIPDSVTSIGSSAFSSCSSLAEVTIPDNVTSIGNYAFNSCSSLTEVTIGNGVTSIGNYAFQNCSGLKSVEFLGNAPTTIGTSAFPSGGIGKFVIYYHSGTAGWTTPTWNGYYTACIGADPGEYGALDENLRNSQGILFTLNGDSMTAVVGDNSTVSNNSGYFGNNDGKVVIPATVTTDGKTYKVIGIGQHAFEGNNFLKTLELGANITSVDPTAFLFCSAFDSFTVATGSTHYSADDGILYDAVGYYLYCYPAAKSGNSYTVPATVKTIGQNAFFGNTLLTELIVPDSVQTIGSAAFAGCTNLESITLPFIGSSRDTSESFRHAFYYYRWSNNVYVSYSIPKSLKTVVVTGGTLNVRSFEECYYIESITLPAQDTTIPNYCFYNCRALKQLLFTDTIEASKELKEGYVILPERITSIGYEAFYDCNSLKFVQLPGNLKEIGRYAFSSCSGLTRVEIPASVTSIGECAFNLCTSVTEFVVNSANQKYCSDQWGVLYSKDMTNLIVYPTNRKWPYYNVPAQTTTISYYAFNSCANLVNLYIPSTVTNLIDGCIVNCPGLTVCAYADSKAYQYAGEHDLTAWPMDNYTLQGIEIYALPETLVMDISDEFSLDGLYVTADYGGKTLQLDDYTLVYDPNESGIQTVSVTFDGYTASFEILLYNGSTEYLVDFGELDLEEGTTGYMAMYDTDGKMLRIDSVSTVNGRAMLVVPNKSNVGEAKLFILNGSNYVPISAPIGPITSA